MKDDEPTPEAAPNSARMCSLLLVDDDPHILKSLRIYLEMEKFQVRTARSGQEALQLIDEELPDLVVLDIMMPDMDGFKVLDQLRNDTRTKDLHIIMLTAKGQDADVLRGHQQGVSSYMTKPVNYDELVDNIRIILGNEEIQTRKGKASEL